MEAEDAIEDPTEDPHVQRIHLEDGNQLNAIFQIVFTSDELMSKDTFCRGITKVVSRKYKSINSRTDLRLIDFYFSRTEFGVLGARPISNIDANALKSLVG